MKKSFFIICVIILMTLEGFSQSLKRVVIGSLANSGSRNSYTIGQAMSGPSEDSSYFGVLGFQHPVEFAIDPTSNAGSVVNVCGLNYTITAGQAPYYQWYRNNTIIPGAVKQSLVVKEDGAYYVQFSDGQSKYIDSRIARIYFRDRPVAEVQPFGNISICPSEELQLSVKRGNGYQYQWKRSGVELIGQNQNIIKVKTAGNYSVIVSSLYGCSTNSNVVTVKVDSKKPDCSGSVSGNLTGTRKMIQATNRQSENFDDELNVYPNPVNIGQDFKLQRTGKFAGVLRYRITDSKGQLIKSGRIASFEQTMILRSPAGIYLLELENATNEHKVVKLIVR